MIANRPKPSPPDALAAGAPNRAADRMSLFAEGAALVVALVGLAVLLGWAAGIESLKNIVSGYSTMKPDTALSFLAGGLSLWLAATGSSGPDRRRVLAAGLAVVVTLVAVSAVLQSVGGPSPSPARPASAFGAGSSPGRMAIATAIGFGFLGPALWLIQSRRPMFVLAAQSLALAGLLGALVGLLGYLFDVEALRLVAPYSSVALHTAATMALLALGILYARPRLGFIAEIAAATPGGTMARRLLTTIVLVLPALGLLNLTGVHADQRAAGFGLALTIAAGGVLVAAMIWLSARSVNRSHYELSASEARYHRLFEGNPLPVLIFDPDSLAILEANRAALDFYGYSREEFRRLGLDAIRPPESEPLLRQRLPLIGDTPRKIGTVFHHKKDGGDVEVEITAHRIELDARPVGVGVIREIAERTVADAHPQLAAAVLDNMAEGIAITDADARVVAVNPAFTFITGYVPQDVIGRNLRLLQSDRHDKGFYQAMWQTLLARGRWRGEIWNRRKDGEPYPELLSITAVRNEMGQISHYVGVFADMSERLRHQQELQAANATLERRITERTAQLQAAVDELEAFTYSVADDLRAPLRSLDGYSLLVLNGYFDRLDAAGQDYLRRIRYASQRLAQQLDDLLALSRITQADTVRVPVDLSGLAQEIAADFQVEMPERKVEWHIAPDLRADGDPFQMRLLMENLLGNAWKYTRKRETAHIEIGQLEAVDGNHVFFVRDNGAGFDMAYADKLFKPFQRLHHASDFPGSGIGLASAARVVARHGGRVWAEAVLDKGATLFFTLSRSGSGAHGNF